MVLWRGDKVEMAEDQGLVEWRDAQEDQAAQIDPSTFQAKEYT